MVCSHLLGNEFVKLPLQSVRYGIPVMAIVNRKKRRCGWNATRLLFLTSVAGLDRISWRSLLR